MQIEAKQELKGMSRATKLEGQILWYTSHLRPRQNPKPAPLTSLQMVSGPMQWASDDKPSTPNRYKQV